MAKDELQVGRFPVISDEDPDEGEDDPSFGTPGTPFQKDWWIWEDGAEGDTIGIVHVQMSRSNKPPGGNGRMVCHVVFEFDDEDVLIASGVLPFRQRPHWVGNGRLAILGGTGPYKGLTKNLFVDVTNPKRWSIGG
ncbi:MAG: hypothetical protein ACXWXQ_04395 [Actinomycetota bacterium]